MQRIKRADAVPEFACHNSGVGLFEQRSIEMLFSPPFRCFRLFSLRLFTRTCKNGRVPLSQGLKPAESRQGQTHPQSRNTASRSVNQLVPPPSLLETVGRARRPGEHRFVTQSAA